MSKKGLLSVLLFCLAFVSLNAQSGGNGNGSGFSAFSDEDDFGSFFSSAGGNPFGSFFQQARKQAKKSKK